MNEPHYRWLRHHLLTMPPEQFDYVRSVFDVGTCGCVAVQVARHQGQTRGAAGYSRLAQFLRITEDEAYDIYYGYANDGAGFFGVSKQDDPHGTPGILRAVRCLDEIAAKYGLSPDAPPDPPAWTPDEAAFVAKLKAEMETVW